MRKKIFLVFLLLLLAIAGSILWYFFYQPEPVVTDETQGESSVTESGGESRENECVLNKNIHIYTGDDAQAVNESITSVEFGDNGLILRFPDNIESGPAMLGRENNENAKYCASCGN